MSDITLIATGAIIVLVSLTLGFVMGIMATGAREANKK